MKKHLLLCFIALFTFCKPQKKDESIPSSEHLSTPFSEEINDYAKGFSIQKQENDITLITVFTPWPGATKEYKYALIPKEKLAAITLDKNAYDAIVATPVEKIVVTSTTHIPALESLGVLHTLKGFPDTEYVSSEKARALIEQKKIKELGSNHNLNTEMLIDLQPELVIGFSINDKNSAYETVQKAGIPVVYNGDWTEETPLGKAEWIKFFAPFFGLEDRANTIFSAIKTDYNKVKELAKNTKEYPSVMAGAIYQGVWYTPGGQSWAATFMDDANANYIWKDTKETGSLSLSLENVIEKGNEADFWIAPAQYTSYQAMTDDSEHYNSFTSFKKGKVFTFSKTVGATGGLLYYELAPNRPDLVLKDLVHIFHPDVLPNHKPFFFKPLD